MDEENELIALRRKKLDALRAKGIEPFGSGFEVTGSITQVREKFKEGETLRAAGRITAHRDMGKSHFLDLRDATGRIQIYIHAKEVGPELVDLFRLLDLGDFIGVEGTCFVTKSGEPTLKVRTFQLLAKALRPLPEKWHGLQDIEARYRQRYLDIITNERSRAVFEKRVAIMRETRRFLEERGFVEVETPILQTIPGGAAAEPFITHHKALGLDLYLRIALELYLKRLLVGGFTKVFEINRNFRNEGISRKHNPEFTMLEAYCAFGDYESMMELVEAVITTVAEKVLGTVVIEHRHQSKPVKEPQKITQTSPDTFVIENSETFEEVIKTIDLTRPWKRARYKDLVKEKAGADWFDISPAERRQRAHDLGAEIGKEYEDFEVTGAVFEKLIEPTLIQPTFVTHLPKELVPLAKLSPDDPTTVEVFECCINGQEIAPGYTEQNDPIAQRSTLEHQAGGEQQKLDEDFLVALEHGMPPAGGIGIGIDRLCMMLLGQESIRDVILFPQLKPK